MAAVGEWMRRIGYRLNRGRVEAALEEEMRAHRSMMGEPARFGNTLALRERSRDVWGWNWLDAIVRDLRFAARGLVRTPVFTIAATLSLALGLALTATMVSVVNAYLIRTLPYPAVERLYHLRYAPPGPWEPSGMTGLDWSSVQDVVEYPIAASGDTFYVNATGDGGYTVALRGLRAPRSFVDGLGISVVAGRDLLPEDFVSGAEPVALIGHTIWRDRFGSDPAAIGRVIRTVTESRPDVPQALRIVGVIAPGFYFGRDRRAGVVDLMLPHPVHVRTYMVRLREGVPPAAAEQRLTEAARQAATSPIPPDWTGVELESVRDRSIGTLRPVLFGVTAAVALVLVIVCANVAVLMLLRAMQRQREVAVRLALGSGRRHIARMLLAETSLLCGTALVCGVGLTALALGTVAPLVETELGRPAPNAAGITLDATVLAIVAGVGAIVAVLLSLAPMSSWGRRLTNALAPLSNDVRVATESRSMRRVRAGLMAFEIAGALVLLVGCGLMVRSVVQMLSTDLGFEAGGLRASRIMLRARNYPDAAAFRRFHERFAESLGVTTGSPVAFSSWPPFVPPPEHLIESDAGDAPPMAGTIAVSAGYFSVFGIPVREGRDFTPADASTEAPVAVVSESLARRLWPGESALGHRVRNVERTQGGDRPGPWRTVIGVVGDVRQTYDDGVRRDFYWPRTPDGRYGTFYLRTARPGPRLYEDFQQVAAGIDREAVINEPRVVANENEALAGTRFMTYLLSAFAGGAALLAMLGIYGVTAYAAQQRRKEIAIRIALGATNRTVTAIFLRQGAWLLGGGICGGVAGALLMSRFLQNQVFGVSSFDLLTYVAASLLLAAAGLAAVLSAARAAMASHPLRALNVG